MSAETRSRMLLEHTASASTHDALCLGIVDAQGYAVRTLREVVGRLIILQEDAAFTVSADWQWVSGTDQRWIAGELQLIATDITNAIEAIS